MKVSLNWLREFVDLPDDTAALCEVLTLAGVEVEGIETRGVSIDKVVVAQIVESTQHPNADRLSVCRVNDGSAELRQIVCGAKNYRVGDKVPLALPDAVLPGNFVIKVGKLRGVESQGMLCSAKELRLSEDAEGLLILPDSAEIGAPLDTLFPSDTVLDLEITPNRPDLLSHVGIAREVAALLGETLRWPPEARTEAGEAPAPQIRIDAPQGCPFYTARKISGVKVGPSPQWLRQKLEAVGVRSINNVVDITNFVMLELGQPLHAFDADKVHGEIVVRMASAEEKFLALDGNTYALDSTRDLVIADAERALAIAGVMGGEESGVTQATTTVILESAYFDPASIRRSSRALNLGSESSYRFERGVDRAGVIAASNRAAHLLEQIAGGRIGGIASSGSPTEEQTTITLRYARCHRLTGSEIPVAEMDAALSRFGLQKLEARSDFSTWQAPSFRSDLAREVDLIEEIVRVYGIEKIAGRVVGPFVESTQADRQHDENMRLRRSLAANGFHEARTLSLISDQALEQSFFPHGEGVPLRNALSEDQVRLRPSLIPGLFAALAHNLRVGSKAVRLFELGRVFPDEKTEERINLALLMTGARAPQSWQNGEIRNADFFDLKGILEALGLAELEFHPATNRSLVIAAEIFAGGKLIGHLGQLAPSSARTIDATSAVLFAELTVSNSAERASRKFTPIDKFPAVTRDIAMIVPAGVTHGRVLEILHAAKQPLLTGIALFDVFTDPSGAKVPIGKKSLAYSLTYRAKDRTLTVEEANAAHTELKERLKDGVSALFRE
jgi:phenylalanyl-tRNA synthetase beta chain